MGRLTECPCGSGEYPEMLYDGYNIFMCYACDKCREKQLKKFRKDIMECYPCDEQIEDDY